MLNIAICEDSKSDLEKVVLDLKRFSNEENIEINISFFQMA